MERPWRLFFRTTAGKVRQQGTFAKAERAHLQGRQIARDYGLSVWIEHRGQPKVAVPVRMVGEEDTG